jgi:hypothetical protein
MVLTLDSPPIYYDSKVIVFFEYIIDVNFRKELSALWQHSEEMTRSVSLLSKIVLQHQPDCNVGKKKEDNVAQFYKGHSAIIDQYEFMPGNIENL